MKNYDYVTKVGDGTFKRRKSPMIDLGTYEFKILNTGKMTQK